jgi:hypothetical protein
VAEDLLILHLSVQVVLLELEYVCDYKVVVFFSFFCRHALIDVVHNEIVLQFVALNRGVESLNLYWKGFFDVLHWPLIDE